MTNKYFCGIIYDTCEKARRCCNCIFYEYEQCARNIVVRSQNPDKHKKCFVCKHNWLCPKELE